MRKSWIIAIIIALLFILGSVMGIYVYKNNQTQDSNMLEGKQLAQLQNQESENKAISTAAEQEKISPNSIVIQKQYFKGCDHIIKEVKDMPEELVNKPHEELNKYYSNWIIEDFTNNELTIYKEREGYCNQHYLIKEHNGVLGIYTLDENGKQTLKEDTEIQTMYLPETDLEKVKNGIAAVGDIELHTVLEDFE